MTNIKLTILLLAVSFSVNAQKLPNVQKAGVWAPANIKIDGKLIEWPEGLQAHNKSTGLFYTLSNDENNLYLTIQATDNRIIEKIIGVGINVIIDKKGKSDDVTTHFSLTYPVISVKSGLSILATAGIKNSNILAWNSRDTVTKNINTLRDRDSLITVANKIIATGSKMMKVNNARGIVDSLISVYNEFGIKGASAFDRERIYNCELAIPLKFLDLGSQRNFNYCIKLRNRLDDKTKHFAVTYKYRNGEQVDVNLDLDSTTDFWGEYVLAKK